MGTIVLVLGCGEIVVILREVSVKATLDAMRINETLRSLVRGLDSDRPKLVSDLLLRMFNIRLEHVA